MKPLFIPLRREYYDAFKSGDKTAEYRPYGPRWNELTCPVGRLVRLSCGPVEASPRLFGVVVGFRVEPDSASLPGWSACYGHDPGPAAVIEIDRFPTLAAIRCAAARLDGPDERLGWEVNHLAPREYGVYYEAGGRRFGVNVLEDSVIPCGFDFAGKAKEFVRASETLDRVIETWRERASILPQ